MTQDRVYSVFVSGATLTALRARVLETQSDFGRRFGVTRRTIIRWQKSGTRFLDWERPKSDAWRALAAKYPDLLQKSEKGKLWK